MSVSTSSNGIVRTFQKREVNVPVFWVSVGILVFLLLIPLLYALLSEALNIAFVFLMSALFTAFITIILYIVRPLKSLASWFGLGNTTKYSEFLLIIIFFLFIPAVASVPFVMITPEIGIIGAYFEATSALTTTGATLFSQDIVYSESLILWRSLLAAYGGFAIVVFASAILSPRGFDGRNFSALSDSTTNKLDCLEDRIFLACQRYFKLYFYGIFFGFVSFVFVGNTVINSFLLAISGIATCGFKIPSSGSEVFVPNHETELILFFLMLYGAFLPVIMLYTTRYRKQDKKGIDAEVKLGLSIICIVSTVVFLRHWFGALEFNGNSNLSSYYNVIWGTLFTITSFSTTTGIESVYWPEAQLWSGLTNPAILLLFLSMIGGASSSTTGGIKLMRILHLFHQSLTELLKLILPNQVVKKKLSAYETENLQSAIQTTWVFFMLFIMVFAVGLCVLTFMGLEFESSLIVTLSSLTNTGPAYNLFTLDSLEYRVFRAPVQIVLCFLMILGRIETLVLIAFLNPYHWMKFK